MDRTLVDRARDGDLDAFESLVEQRIRDAFRLSLVIVGDEAGARDVARDAFVAAWRDLPRLQEADRFDAWVDRLVVNQARASRSGRRLRVREIAASEILAAAVGSTWSAGDDAELLRLGLRDLSIDQRALLAMHHLEGRPIDGIASILGIAAGTVTSRLVAARRALTKAIAEGIS